METDSLENLVHCYTSLDSGTEERESILNLVNKRIEKGEVIVQALIDLLGQLLNGADPSTRTRGSLLLATVIERCDTILDREVVHALIGFFTKCLVDAFTTQSATQALTFLVEKYGLTTEEVHKVANELFTIQAAGLPTNTRRQILNLCKLFVNNYCDAMQQIETKTVQGFINIMDGEREPFNLMTAFQLHFEIMTKLDQANLGYFHAEMFDVVSCYFPITFTPLANDPHAITPDDLKAALVRCMVLPEFAPHCLPFLTDKLGSPIVSTKLDVLDALEKCCKSYEHSVLAPFLAELWKTFRSEILDQIGEDDDKSVLEALMGGLAKVVEAAVACEDQDKVNAALQGLTGPILTIATSAISTNTASYASILHYSAAGSSASCSHLARIMIPKLRNLYLHAAALGPSLSQSNATAMSAVTSADGGLTDSMKQRETIVILFVALLSAVRKLTQDGQEPTCKIGTAVDIMLECLLTKTTPTLERAALEGVGYCAIIRSLQKGNLVAECHEDSIYTLLSSVYINTPDHATRKVALRTLTSICTVNPKLINEKVVEGFKEILLKPNTQHVDKILDALIALAPCKSPSAPELQANISAHIVAMVLHVLIDAVEKGAIHEQAKISVAFADIIKPFTTTDKDGSTMPEVIQLTMKMVLHLWTGPHDGPLQPDAAYSEAVYNLSLALQSIMAITIPATRQSDILTQMLGCHQANAKPPIPPMDLALLHPNQVLLFKTALAASRSPAIPLHGAPLVKAMDSLLAIIGMPGISSFGDRTPRGMAYQCLAILLNKTADADSFNTMYTQTALGALIPTLKDSSKDVHQRVSCAHALCWLQKGLAMRQDPKTEALGDIFLALVSDPKEPGPVRTAAHESFGAVLTPVPGALSKELHSTVKFLWDQKFFSRHLPLLMEVSNQASDADSSMHTFCALSGLIKPCREAIILNHVGQLMPLLTRQLKSQAHKYQLNINDTSTKPYVVSTLGTLQSIFAASTPAMKDTFATILEPLLVFATFKHAAFARLTCVQIIQSFTSLPFSILRPYKPMVTKRLIDVLDDPKRAIRKCATDTRNKWFSLSDPEAAD
uniref:MMS19 nucleotide excision repair protein n=1 Tax=Eutreptiella gymnastica TaxID=73025 RepID=A0A7S1HYB5_9EUGL|mmetsp:Transcript_11389/g.20534  ORF Transcript_11389/g.20534 Transcript_11389/m.20534 type:complete len:1070 (+) Transcript_11389:28-3237(+)